VEYDPGSNEKLFIGRTNNLHARICSHNSDKYFTTKNKDPWKLIFSRGFESRSEAMKVEKDLKSIKDKNYILKLISSDKI
jgi:putative endonuclease